MDKEKKLIYPMMIELNETIKDTLYYLPLPKTVKDKWIELERRVKPTFNQAYNLPTITLKNIMSTYLDGVIDMSPVSSSSEDKKWLVSFRNFNIKIVLSCFKIWIDEFYIYGVIAKDSKRKKGDDEGVCKLAEELKMLMTTDLFQEVISEEITLFQNGYAVSKEAYQLYPLRIVSHLMGKTLFIKGIENKLLYSSRNEIITDSHTLHNEEDYYSFLIKLSVQTLPPDNKAYLNIDLSVRRWICRNEKNDGNIYLANDKNCYIRVKDDRLQSIKTEYNHDDKENIWKSIDYRCFNECQVDSNIPGFTDVLKKPGEYNKGKVGDVLIPYEEGIPYIDTSVKAGVSFMDRKTAFEYVRKHVFELDSISSNIEAINIKRTVLNRKKDFSEEDPGKIDSEVFLKQLEKALSSEKLTIEIYAEAELSEALMNKLGEYLKNNSLHEIKCCELNDIGDPLVSTSTSKKENIPGVEEKVKDIIQRLDKVNAPTLALIAIHNKDYFEKLERELQKKLKKRIDLDPKKAIRCGFAETGRLTQFITFEEFENQEKESIKRNERYEKKKMNALVSGKPIKAQNKTDKLNLVIEGSVRDGFRQLGIVYDYEINKHMKGKKIVGVHACNYKKTLYGSIPLFPIIITYDVDSSMVTAYCELVDKVDLPYWKVILGLSKLALKRDTSDLAKTISNTTTYRRLERIINKSDSDTVIIVDANGTSRQIIKGIANSEIEKKDKNKFDQIEKLFVMENKDINLTESKKELAIIRIRHNDEVPTYFTMDKVVDSEKLSQNSGIFKYDKVYYSIDQKPLHEDKTYIKEASKAIDISSFSHRNILEIYPMYISGDEKNHEINEEIAVGIVDMLRSASIQFSSQKTVLPLTLHLAEKMEEYI
jgi:hypothetical protein